MRLHHSRLAALYRLLSTLGSCHLPTRPCATSSVTGVVSKVVGGDIKAWILLFCTIMLKFCALTTRFRWHTWLKKVLGPMFVNEVVVEEYFAFSDIDLWNLFAVNSTQLRKHSTHGLFLFRHTQHVWDVSNCKMLLLLLVCQYLGHQRLAMNWGGPAWGSTQSNGAYRCLLRLARHIVTIHLCLIVRLFSDGNLFALQNVWVNLLLQHTYETLPHRHSCLQEQVEYLLICF